MHTMDFMAVVSNHSRLKDWPKLQKVLQINNLI